MRDETVRNESTVLFPEDTVVRRGSKDRQQGLVMRCPGELDEQVIATFPDDDALHSGPNRALKAGEVSIFFRDGRKSIVKDTDLELVDRNFMLGDLVRCRSSHGQHRHGAARAIVVCHEKAVKLEGVFSGNKIDEWIPTRELVNSIRITRGDHVAAEDWLGSVEDVFEEATVQLFDGETLRICDQYGSLTAGTTMESLMQEREAYELPTPPLPFEIVLENNPSVVAIRWLALNQKARPASFAAKKDIDRFWQDMSELCLVRSSADHLLGVGDKVFFRTTADAMRHGAPTPQRINAANAFLVIESKSEVTLLWQDGTRSKLPACDVEPAGGIDEEHDVFPGDLAFYSGEGERRLGIVQRMNVVERTADVRWHGTDDYATVSVLDLDPNGPPPGSLGVRRGDLVMVTTDPCPTFPMIGRLGETEFDFPTPEALRNQLSGLAMVNTQRAIKPPPIRTGPQTEAVDWYAEVVDLGLDGRATIRYPCGRQESIPQDRLILFLDDSFDEIEEGWSGDSFVSDQEPETTRMRVSSDDSWTTEESRDEWMSEDGRLADSAPDIMRSDQNEQQQPENDQSMDENRGNIPKRTPDQEPFSDDGDLQHFAILEAAPEDHYFFKEAQQAPTRAFSQRIQREYRALKTSLPENVCVRAFEDRIDLLRCLIIGSSHTPYQDAPFLFDLFLAPSTYPSEPPLVHFHSWTAGSGRVNPNLYMEGKVCLSLLNTWHGEKVESWNAARSSVFQILISIQGLVLVKEPWYLEPGFEKQRGTAEAALASNVYSERTWVLSRAHVRQAVESPPGGLSDVIAHYYLRHDGGCLKHIVQDIRAVLVRTDRQAEEKKSTSEINIAQSATQSDSEWPHTVTLGSAIPLRRTLMALERVVAMAEGGI